MAQISRVAIKLTVLALLVTFAAAWATYIGKIPNGNNIKANGVTVAAAGHTNTGGGGARNAFGNDFAVTGQFTWNVALCQKDSDNDGFSNGVELGDPQCIWTEGATPERTTGISNPGDASSLPVTPPPDANTPAPTPAPPTPAPTVPPYTGVIDPLSLASASAAGSNWYEAVEDHLWITWGMANDQVSGQDYLLMSMRVRGDFYGAVGFSEEQMTGPMITCYVTPTGLLGGVADYDGDRYAVIAPKAIRADQDTAKWSKDPTNGDAVCSYRVRTDLVNIKKGEAQRVIFARGPYKAFPTPHAGSLPTSIGRAVVDWYGLSIKNTYYPEFPYLTIAWIITVVAVVVCLIAGLMLNKGGAVFSPLATKIAVTLQLLLFLVCFSLIIALSDKDLRDAKRNETVFRAFAHGASFLFAFLLLPVTKHTSVFRLYGMSYERAIQFHLLMGFLLVICTTIHAAGMIHHYNTDQPFVRKYITDWGGHRQVNLAGIISYAVLMFICLIAMFLRRKFFTLFRMTHFLFTVVVVFAIIHHNVIGLVMIPGLFLWVVDLVFRVWSAKTASPEVANATYDAEGKFTKIEIRMNGTFAPEGGQYCFLGFEKCGPLMHPFSIANFDTNKQIATFFIKNMGDGKYTDCIGKNAAASALKIETLMGPYGSLQVPLHACKTAVLVSGGIGITPMMSLLQDIGRGVDGADAVQHVVFVWSFRDKTLGDAVAPYLMASAAAAAKRRCVVEWHLHNSSGKVKNIDKLEVKSGRPDINAIVSQTKSTRTYDDGRGVGIYACGPAKMIDDANVAATSNSTYFHSETFEF